MFFCIALIIVSGELGTNNQRQNCLVLQKNPYFLI